MLKEWLLFCSIIIFEELFFIFLECSIQYSLSDFFHHADGEAEIMNSRKPKILFSDFWIFWFHHLSELALGIALLACRAVASNFQRFVAVLAGLTGQRIVAVFCIDASMSCFAAGATQSNVSAPFSTPIKISSGRERPSKWRGLCSGSSSLHHVKISPNELLRKAPPSP